MRVNRVCGQWRTMSRVPERKSFGCAGSPTYLKRDRGPLDTRICRPGESRGHRYIVGSSLTSESGIRGPGTASEGTSPIRTAVALSPLRSSREDRHRSAPRRRASADPPRSACAIAVLGSYLSTPLAETPRPSRRRWRERDCFARQASQRVGDVSRLSLGRSRRVLWSAALVGLHRPAWSARSDGVSGPPPTL